MIDHGVKPIFILISLLIATMSFGQVQTQKGVSYRYNGKNPRTPLPNVTIKCVTANNTAISDSTGSFTLVFNKLKMGDRMGLVTVKKREMMVFNQHAVDEWSIRKEPLCLILCDADEFDRQKREYMDLGRRDAKRKYDRQKAELEKQLEEGMIKLEDMENALSVAYERLERLQKEIDKYADDLARIDLSELDGKMQEILDMYQRGETEEAIEKLKSLKLAEEFDKETAHHEAMQQELQKSDSKLQILVEQMKNSIPLCMNSGEWEEAGKYLKRIADRVNDYESLYEYASFCQHQNYIKEAEVYYQKVLQLFENIDKESFRKYRFEKACTLHNLANLYSDISKSETLYLETINICNELLEEKDTRAYSLKLLALSNLASLYFRNRQDTQCEELLAECGEIIVKVQEQDSLLIEQDPALQHAFSIFLEMSFSVGLRLNKFSNEDMEQLQNLMDTLSMDNVEKSFEELLSLTDEDVSGFISIGLPMIRLMGNLFYQTKQFSKCEYVLQKSLEKCRKAADENPDAYNPVLIQSIQNLADFYYSLGRFSESEPLYEEALEIGRKLAKDDPQAFVLGLVNNLTLLGNLYCTIGYNNNDLDSFDKSKTLLEEALETLQTITETSTISYEENLIGILNSLGNLYLNIADFKQDIEALEKSENAYAEVIEIERRLAKDDSQFHEPGLASALNALGNVYYSMGLKFQDTQSYKKSEDLYKESIAIGRKLAENDPQTYNYGLAGSLIIYGNLQRDMGDFQQCEQTYKEALMLWRNLAKDNPELYEPGLAEALINVAQYKQLSMQYKEGIKLLEESHKILKRLINAGNTENQNLYLSNLLVLGDLYSLSENYEKAYLCYQESDLILKMLIEDNETLKAEYSINLGNLSYSNLLLKRFSEAERYASEALTIDISQEWVFTNLAAALLLQGKYSEAEEIYRNMKNTLKDGMLEDLNLFERKALFQKKEKKM